MGFSPANEHRDPGGTRRRAYDDLRNLGVGHDAAKAGAEEAAAGTHTNLERHFGGGLSPAGGSSSRRSPFRVRFPWETPEAGISLPTPSRGAR